MLIYEVWCDDVDSSRPAGPAKYLSVLQAEYLTKLPGWWLDVHHTDGDAVSNSIDNDIVNAHKEFVFDASKEQLKLNYWRTFLLHDIEYFNENVTAIFNTLKENSDFLYDEKIPHGNVYNRSELLVWARSEKTLELKTNIQALFDITLQPNVVFKHIQKVCLCLL